MVSGRIKIINKNVTYVADTFAGFRLVVAPIALDSARRIRTVPSPQSCAVSTITGCTIKPWLPSLPHAW
ncbi:hypothetical protein DPMN_033248 [Dreissena polymorpha]|uniref:Uncharacterized protein n=1 Tax=Dreissena polymorpha TaxID=45954 RepID=A0A9D4M4H6_DREPO|nr:hypothetical protein DPMN_033248 [Dreissena polymorpha]